MIGMASASRPCLKIAHASPKVGLARVAGHVLQREQRLELRLGFRPFFVVEQRLCLPEKRVGQVAGTLSGGKVKAASVVVPPELIKSLRLQ